MLKEIKGGFQRSVRVFSVAKNGNLTLVSTSGSCTYKDDAPSKVITYDDNEPLLVVVSPEGRDDNAWGTQAGNDRLAKAGSNADDAFKEWWETEYLASKARYEAAMKAAGLR